MKKIITYFIKYPVAVNVIIIAFLIFGYLGAKSMKSSYFPLSDSRNIMVRLTYPGASPEEMEEGVVLKIEDNLKGIVGIDRVTSTSQENSATINIETIKGKNIDVVLADAPVIWQQAAVYENDGVVALPGFLSREPIAWATSKSDPELLEQVNQALSDMANDGTLRKILLRWIPEYAL